MTYTAKALLFGMLAFLIPLIIHLLNRSRHRRIQWGAMHLLNRVVRTNQRRLLIQQLILLLLRCAFPVLLALALAGPVLTKFNFLPGDAPGTTIILVDHSYSMSSNDAFDRASAALDEILESQAEGTEIALVSVGANPAQIEPPTLDRRQVRREFESEIHPDADPASIPAALDFARQILEKSSRPRRTIFIISDFQRADWQAELNPDENTAFAFYPVGKPSENNIAVENLTLPPIALTVGQKIQIQATIRNYGDAINEIPVFLRVNGDRVAASQVDLTENGTADVSFERHFDDRGSHLVQIEIDADDSLAIDNRLPAAIEVPERLPVLVVDSSAAAERNFLKAALTPFELDGVGIEDLIEATFIEPSEFQPMQLFGSRAVILTNTENLTEAQTFAIDEFVRGGGGLVVFPGPETNLTWFNDEFFPLLAPDISWERILPVPNEPAKILREPSNHPVFEIFNETGNGDPSAASIRTWLNTSSSEKTQTLSRFTNHPFITESSHLPGRVIIASTGIANQWTDMPTQPFYVPLMQRLVVYAATNTVPPRNVEVGQPLVALLHPKTAGETLELTDPAGHTHKVVAETEGGVAKAVFPIASRPGPWTLTNPHGSGPIRFAVQSERAESDLQLLSNSELNRAASKLSADIIRTRAEVESFERASRFGSEIWRPVLIFALLLLFADVFLAQRFVRGSSAPVKTN